MSTIKATKWDVMRFVREREVIEISDLVERFGYSPPVAHNKIIRLEKAGILEKLGVRRGAYLLSSKAHKRLEYHERTEQTE